MEHWCSYIAPGCTRSVFPFSVMDTNDEMEKGSFCTAFIVFPMTAVVWVFFKCFNIFVKKYNISILL